MLDKARTYVRYARLTLGMLILLYIVGGFIYGVASGWHGSFARYALVALCGALVALALLMVEWPSRLTGRR